MFSAGLLLAKLLDMGAGRGLEGRVGFLCLFKKQARMSTVTSEPVFELCASALYSVCVDISLISGVERVKAVQIFKTRPCKVSTSAQLL